MRLCPGCGDRLLTGSAVCSSCGARADCLIDTRTLPGFLGKMSLLTTAPDSITARKLAMRLESCGIPCQVNVSPLVKAGIEFADPECARQTLYVPELMLTQAKVILRWDMVES